MFKLVSESTLYKARLTKLLPWDLNWLRFGQLEISINRVAFWLQVVTFKLVKLGRLSKLAREMVKR